MKVLISKEVSGDFLFKIVKSDNDKIAVRTETKLGEFIGQMFVSQDEFAEIYKKLTGVELSKDEIKSVTDEFTETESKMSSILNGNSKNELVYEDNGVLLADLELDNKKFKKGTKVEFTVKDNNLFVNGLSEPISLTNGDYSKLIKKS